MGVYGLQSWGEYFARQINRELHEEQQRVARISTRMERTQELLRADAAANHGEEPLGCPACKARFDLGDHCPECDVELVGEAWVDGVDPQPRRNDSRAERLLLLGAFHVAAFVTCVVLTSVFLFIEPHRIPPLERHVEAESVESRSQRQSSPTAGVHRHQRIAYAEVGTALTHRLWVQLEPAPLNLAPTVHLLAPGGELDTPLDCHRRIDPPAPPAAQDWGRTGTPADDPEVWTSPVNPGVEGVRILAPAPGVYTVSLVADPERDTRRHRGEVKVYVDGKLVFDELLSVSPAAPSLDVCEIEFPTGDVRVL